MFIFKAVTSFVLISIVIAQTPHFLNPLLIEPLMNSAKCLTAAEAANGVPVTIEDCTGSQNQQWSFVDGSVKLFNDQFCLDVTNGVQANGTPLQIWSCSSGNPNQQWFYTEDLHLAWTNHQGCLDLKGGSLADGNVMQLWGCGSGNTNQIWNVGYHLSALPFQSEQGQTGYNNCGFSTTDTSECQTAWINSAEDFCLWAPPSPGGTIGDTEEVEVVYCTKSGRGARPIPDGTLQGVHFVKTVDYVQVTGVGDFTKINIQKGDEGGELDPHGATGVGNPIGGLVFGSSFSPNLQYHEWTSFISDTEFCFRACIGANAAENCQHIYDVMGCFWNMPANYDAGVFENCEGDDDLPMGVYGTSTWFQGEATTPAAHPVASSSSCTPLPSISLTPLQRRRDDVFEYVRRAPEPTHLY